MGQASCKYEMPRLELKSLQTFLAIKRCEWTKFGKVIKLARSSMKGVFLLMLFSYSKARRADKLSSVMFAGRDGRTADAEHQQRQRRHIHAVYGPPRDRYAWFAMPAMLGASAAEVQ
jgi:hypothetical protein